MLDDDEIRPPRLRDYAAGIVRAIVAIPMLAFEEIEREAERREKILKTIEDGEDGEDGETT